MQSKLTSQRSCFSVSHLVEVARCFLLVLIDRITLMVPCGHSSDGKTRVLIIRLDAVGDFVLWLDAARALRTLYPPHSHELYLLGNLAWCGLAEHFPYFDHVWPLDRNKFIENISYRFAVMKKIRMAGFLKVVQPTYSREFFFGDEVVRVSGARERTGYESNCSNTSRWGLMFSDRWYTRLIPAAPGLSSELVRNAEFIRKLGFGEFRAAVPELKYIATCDKKLLPSKYYVIVPGAGASLRQWPVARFKEVAKRIYQLTGWAGVICGVSSEEHLGAAIVCDEQIPLVNLVGDTSLAELNEVISGARVVVGNESSAIHFAAALSTPAVCVMGGGHYGRFLPYNVEVPTCNVLPETVCCVMECFGCDWRCIFDVGETKPAPCISQITVEIVMSRIEKIITKIESENTRK